MPWYRCSLHGENFPIGKALIGKRLMGFYTTRWVEAADPETAELACLELLRSDPGLAHARGGRIAPMVYLEEIVELDEPPENPPGSGFSFYRMGT